MRRILTMRVACILPWAIAAGLIGGSSDASAQSNGSLKLKKRSSTVVRAQNAGDNQVTTTSALADEEVLDRELPSNAGACVPNCVNGMNGDQSIFDCPLPNGQPSAGPQPLVDQNSPLSNPNSVFTPQQQSQLPAPVSSLPAGQGASTAMSQVPAFMGDFFGGAPTTVSQLPIIHGMYPPYNSLNSGNSVSIPSATGVGIMKLAENTSPLPRDRVFLSYNYFGDVNLAPGGIAVNRMTPGFEKTLFGGNASVEIRLPMAMTLGSNTSLTPGGAPIYNSNQYEFGNLTTYFKALLYRDAQFALSAGFGVGAPTASATKITDSAGNNVATINNQAWNLMPFLGSVYTPNDRWYAQTMLQLDVAANGNSVYTQSAPLANSLYSGQLNDPTYLFASVGTGYWMYQNPDESARLSRVSLISELHFNTTLQHTDTVQGTSIQVGTYQSQIQTINGVIGTNMMFDQNKSLMIGYVTPLGSSDQAFAGELRVLFNWYFGGPPSRAARVQF